MPDEHDLPSSSAAPLARSVEELDLPHGVTVRREHGALVLTRSWFRLWRFLTLGAWCAVWDSFVFGAIFQGELPLLFWLTHGGTGLAITYAWLAMTVNKTTITVSNGVLSVRHGPLPSPGARDVPARDVKQLYVEERKGQKDAVSYELWMLRNSGKPLALVKGVGAFEQAQLLEEELERHLGIEDRAVIAGEMR